MLEFAVAAPYAFFFLAAALLTGLIAWRHGERAGWTIEQRAALYAAVLIGANIGSRWLPVEGYIPQDGDKTVVGALVGGGTALALALRALGMGLRTIEATIPAFPIGMAVGRIGCFLAGCCFGTPTTLAWGTSYAAGTLPFKAMVAAGLVPADAAATSPLHPAQLYEAGLDLAAAALVIAFRRHLRATASAPLLYLALYGVIRFGAEFVRFEGVPIGGLKPLQWALAVFVPLALGVLVHRERVARRAANTILEPSRSTFGGATAAVSHGTPTIVLGARDAAAGFNIFALAILVSAIVSVPFASPIERICFLAAALLLLFALAVRHQARGRLFAPVGALALMVQGGGPPVSSAPDTTYPRRWFSIGAAANAGSRSEKAFETSELITDVCGTYNVRTPHYRDHAAFAVGVTGELRKEPTHETGTGVRASLFGGQNGAKDFTYSRKGTDPSDGKGSTFAIGGARAVLDLDARLIGMSIGGVVGSIPVSNPDDTERVGVDKTGALPIFALRMKLPWAVRFEMSNDVDPTPLGSNTVRTSLGYKFGKLGSSVRVGAEGNGGSFASVKIVTKGGYEVEPSYASVGKNGRFSIALKRRFGLPD